MLVFLLHSCLLIGFSAQIIPAVQSIPHAPVSGNSALHIPVNNNSGSLRRQVDGFWSCAFCVDRCLSWTALCVSACTVGVEFDGIVACSVRFVSSMQSSSTDMIILVVQFVFLYSFFAPPLQAEVAVTDRVLVSFRIGLPASLWCH